MRSNLAPAVAKIDQEAIRKEPAAWAQLTDGRATLQKKLLTILWSADEFKAHREELLELCARFGLAVPVPYRTDEFLVPSLLHEGGRSSAAPARPPADAARLRLHFYLDEPSAAGEAGTLVYDPDELSKGFLPMSVFHRLCAAALGCSYQSGSAGGAGACLDRHHAHVNFERELLTLSYMPAESSVLAQLHSDGRHGGAAAALADRLRVLVSEELAAYANLRCRILAPLPHGKVGWVDLNELSKTKAAGATVSFRGEQLRVDELKAQLALYWLTEQCDFYFIRADKLREASAAELPRMLRLQEMMAAHGDWVVKKSISFEQACLGAYTKEYLAVSHRWESPEQPDVSGAQLATLQRYLRAHTGIKFVWYDVRLLKRGIL